MEYKNQNNNQRPIISLPINGCLMAVILSAIAGIMVNECKRSKIRLENDKQKYQNDTLRIPKTVANNTLFLKDFVRTR